MQELQERTGTAIIMITHDLGVVADMADSVLVMYAGTRGRVRHAATRSSTSPLHPYTWGLMDSHPAARRRREGASCARSRASRRRSSTCPPGCSFHPRCPYAKDDLPDRGAASSATIERRARRRVPLRRRPGLHARRDGVRRGGERVDGRDCIRVEGLTKHFPVQQGVMSRARAEVRHGGRRRLVRGERTARRSASWASRAAASRRPAAASSG